MHGEASGIAANSLGLVYSDETFEWFSMEKACRWFRKAAALGDSWGAYNLADNYALGRGVKRNPKKAIKYYTMEKHLGKQPTDWACCMKMEFRGYLLISVKLLNGIRSQLIWAAETGCMIWEPCMIRAKAVL